MKKEKKILIPGLGVGKSMGLCDTCNMAFGELFVNPSLLLWADRICIPKWCVDYRPDEDAMKCCREEPPLPKKKSEYFFMKQRCDRI